MIDTEVLATFTPDQDGKDNFRDWMAQEEIATWKNIVAFGKVEKVLSTLEQALLVAMLEVTREPDFEGIVDQENGEVDKVSDAISKALFVIQTKVDADNPAN